MSEHGQIGIRTVDGLIVVDWPDIRPQYVSLVATDFAEVVAELNFWRSKAAAA